MTTTAYTQMLKDMADTSGRSVGTGHYRNDRARAGREAGHDRRPVRETKEALGGFYLVEPGLLDEALDLAAQCPGKVGSIEVRPVIDFLVGRPGPAVGRSDRRPELSDAHLHELVDRCSARNRAGRSRPDRVLGDFDSPRKRSRRLHRRSRDAAGAGRACRPRRMDRDRGQEPGDRPASPTRAGFATRPMRLARDATVGRTRGGDRPRWRCGDRRGRGRWRSPTTGCS